MLRGDHLDAIWEHFSNGVSENIDEVGIRAVNNNVTVFLAPPESLDHLSSLLRAEAKSWLVKD